jgi:hypothetical protein
MAGTIQARNALHQRLTERLAPDEPPMPTRARRANRMERMLADGQGLLSRHSSRPSASFTRRVQGATITSRHLNYRNPPSRRGCLPRTL